MAGDEEPAPDVSRRDALKKIGIGAGIAWSAPVVLSFYNAAGAATGTPDDSTTTSPTTLPTSPECTGATCDTFVTCGTFGPNPEDECICVSTPDPSMSFCVPGPTLCDIGPACAPDFTCPPGMFCAIDTCCPFNVCTPLTITGLCTPAEPTNGIQATPTPNRVKSGAGTFAG